MIGIFFFIMIKIFFGNNRYFICEPPLPPGNMNSWLRHWSWRRRYLDFFPSLAGCRTNSCFAFSCSRPWTFYLVKTSDGPHLPFSSSLLGHVYCRHHSPFIDLALACWFYPSICHDQLEHA